MAVARKKDFEFDKDWGPGYQDDFIAHAVQDPAHPPELGVISGLVGRSPLEGHIRCYVNANLTAFLEIPFDAVRWVSVATPACLTLKLLFVDRSVRIKMCRLGERPVETTVRDFIAQRRSAPAHAPVGMGQFAMGRPRMRQPVPMDWSPVTLDCPSDPPVPECSIPKTYNDEDCPRPPMAGPVTQSPIDCGFPWPGQPWFGGGW